MSGLLRGLHNEEDPHYWSKGIVACTYSRDIPVIFRYLYHGQLWLSAGTFIQKLFGNLSLLKESYCIIVSVRSDFEPLSGKIICASIKFFFNINTQLVTNSC